MPVNYTPEGFVPPNAPDGVVVAATLYARNLHQPAYYEGLRVFVTFDPYLTPANGDTEANPTGKTYRLRPLSQCSQRSDNYGGANDHWEIDDEAGAGGGSAAYNGNRPITRNIPGLFGLTPGGLTVTDAAKGLLDLLYTVVPVAATVSLVVSPTTFELGTTPGITLNGAYTLGTDSAPTTGSYRQGSTVLAAQTPPNIGDPVSGGTVAATTAFSFSATFPTGGLKTATATVTALKPLYYGCAAPSASDATLLALTKVVAAHTSSRALSFSGVAGQVFWLLYDPAHPVSSVLDTSGFNVTADWEYVRDVINANGVTLKAWRLKAANAFGTTVTNFTNTFSFS